MCLIVVANHCHERYPLVIAANRDESYLRPTRSPAFWEEAPGVLAGKDLLKGGSWLGMTRDGRFAAVTNFREKKEQHTYPHSRGRLVKNFLESSMPAAEYLEQVLHELPRYDAFNLLLRDRHSLYFLSSREAQHRVLERDIYGVSNGELDCHWPKVELAKKEMASYLGNKQLPDHAPLLEMLADQHIARDELLPDTGVGIELERVLSPVFIQSENYGTRASTVITMDAGGVVKFTEQAYLQGGARGERSYYEFSVKQ